MIILNLIIIIILSLVAYQDLRYKEIHWSLFPMLAIFLIISGLIHSPFLMYLKECAFNILLLTIQTIILSAYYYLRGKHLKSIFNNSIGLGDMAILIAVGFAFSKMNFIIFYLSGLIITLILWLAFQLLLSRKEKLIPLAGFISLYLIMIVLFELTFDQFDRLSDSFLILFLYG